jgi:hypothetical protein
MRKFTVFVVTFKTASKMVLVGLSHKSTCLESVVLAYAQRCFRHYAVENKYVHGGKIAKI